MIYLKINFKKLAIYIIIPLVLGGLVGYLSGSFNGYKGMIIPSFAPPGFLFPIVWSILYILMGVSRYIIERNGNDNDAVLVYNAQLFVNLTWTFLFFTFRWFLFSFIWLLLLILLVILMIIKFYKISKTSAYLQIPYLLWIIFAAVLNFSIYTLN